ncbi:transglycosylase family protein [Gordonia pseudamarae]|uniref:transglycosylase family protein n=1 Tax=Gordonia pseudamarae TaxID=2831662 RepID=UPI001AF57199|nr:transglycosylase family protein [Gordonia pseudamarae]QHN28968.1 peptidoglycan DD-metalloendopeptidase family protein [Gordonia pseudamarae]
MESKGAGLVGLIVLVVAIPVLLIGALVGSGTMDCEDTTDTSTQDNAGGGLTPGTKSWPMKKGTYQVTSGFGPRGGSMHQGVDLGAQAGQPVYAAFAGVVDKAGTASGFGQWIVLAHNINGKRVDTVYGHMFPQDLLVKVGQKVAAGQLITKVGYNGEVYPPGPGGAHLHFEVWPGGWGQQAIDPVPWLADAVEPGKTTPAPATPDKTGPSDDSAPNVVTVADWNKVAEYESGGDWAINTGNGYYGGLQFTPSTWKAFGGHKYAPSADQASPAEQMEVANTTLKTQGWNAWQLTSRKAGVTGKKPAPEGTFLRSTSTSGDTDSPVKQLSDTRTTGTGSVGAVTDAQGRLDLSQPLSASIGTEKNLQTNAVRLARAVVQRFPEIKSVGGWRADGEHAQDHPQGRAIDFMMPHDGRTAADVALGDRILDYVQTNASVYDVAYTIWRQTYTPAGGAGRPMADRGSWNENHYNHVHVTLTASAPYTGGDLGSVEDRSRGGRGQSGLTECDSSTGGNGAPVKPGTIPKEWGRWYNVAGQLCPAKGVTASLLAAQGHQETGGFQQRVQSPVGAKGPGQFMDGTWATWGRDYDGDGRVDVWSLGDAIVSQGHFMCSIADQVDGWIKSGQIDPRSGPNKDRRDLILAGYNAGPGALQQYRGFPPYGETIQYAQIIIANEPKYRSSTGSAESSTESSVKRPGDVRAQAEGER